MKAIITVFAFCVLSVPMASASTEEIGGRVSALAFLSEGARTASAPSTISEGIDMQAVLTLEEMQYETTMKRWKAKQPHLWKNLPKKEFTINASAYTAAADECGKSDGITASGIMVEEKRTIACPPQYPFGARLEIDGMGEYVCEDRGGAIKGNKIDIYMETKKEAFAFGRRNLTARFIDVQ